MPTPKANWVEGEYFTPADANIVGQAIVDLQNEFATVESVLQFKGTWNATTNTPSLVNGTGTAGHAYLVTTAGTALGKTFVVGDYVVYSGTIWDRATSTASEITSTGVVTGSRFVSTVATGTAPLTVASTTVVPNLNASTLNGIGQTISATASTVAARDANGNLNADNFIDTVESTATAATTTTLTMANGGVQVFTGATTQTVVLPSGASVLAGVKFNIINQSTAGAIAVQYPAGTALASVPVGHAGEFVALVSNPTLVTHWRAILLAQPAGVMATTSNSLAAFNQSTTNAIGVGTVELGHASDTTLARVSAGVVSVEGNPLGVKVAVPATATSAGVVGQWAADASWFYICTAATTWRRVAIAAW